MLKDLVGYRFSPTGEEKINYYLKNINLGKTWLVDDAISEINFYSFEPKDLPALSKIKSDDLEWYFLTLIVYANAKKTTMKRATPTGFWKVTAPDVTIRDKRGSKIGIQKTLVHHEGKVGNGVRTPWVMHEYHITSLPQERTTYVLCQVKYKGDHKAISYGGTDSVVSFPGIGREINTVPETVQIDQPKDGLYLNDLSYPLNVKENLCPLDAINPSLLQKTPKLQVQVNRPVEDGSYLNDLSYPLKVKEDLCLLDAINTNLLQRTPEVQVQQLVQDGLYLNGISNPLNVQEDLCPMDAIDPDTFINDDNPNLLQQTPQVQVEQPVQDGFYLNGMSNPLNVQEDLSPMDAIDPNMFFNDDNPNLLQQTPEVQVEQLVQDGFYLNGISNPLNVQEDLSPMEAIDPNMFFNNDNPNLLQQTLEIQVEQPVQDDFCLNGMSNPLNVQEDLCPMDAIDPNMFFNDDNPNLLQQTPEFKVEQPVQDSFYLNGMSNPLNVQEDLCPMDAIDPNMFINDDNPNLLQQTLEIQVEQPVQDDFCLNGMSNPLNVQEDLCPMDAIDPNMFINDDNPNLLQQTPEVQVEQPVQDGFYLNGMSNPLNVQENLCPMDAIDPNMFINDDNPNLLQQTPEVQVELPVQDDFYLNGMSNPLNVQEDLCPMDPIDPNTFINDDNPNLLQQTLEVQIEALVLKGLSLNYLEISENEQDDLRPPDAFDLIPNMCLYCDYFNLPPPTEPCQR